MTDEKRKRGRPKTEFKVRDTRISGYVTKEDAEYVREVADNLGFSSTSEMITAILERLCEGGFSGVSFVKLGWQIANLKTKHPRKGYYLSLRPPAPLLDDEPDRQKLSEHLESVKREISETED